MSAKKEYKTGDIVTGVVTGIEKYGIFVNIDEKYSGLIHISEISDSFVRSINDYVEVGEKIKVKILELQSDDFHAKLTIKNIEYKPNKQKKNKIKEVGTKFEGLSKNMEKWTKIKEEEILSKKN